MKKKVLIFVGVIAVVLLTSLIVYSAMSSGSEPTIIPPTPSATPEDNGRVIEITAAELISQLSSNPNRYKAGTKLRVSGVVVYTTIKSTSIGVSWPEREGDWTISFNFNFQFGDVAPPLMSITKGTKVVVEGKFSDVYTKGKVIYLESGLLVSRE